MAQNQPTFGDVGPDAPASDRDTRPTITPAPPTPDPFVVGTALNTAANTIWTQILADRTLGLSPVETGPPAITLKSSLFWDVNFSSSQNSTKFDSGFNGPAVGDSLGSGVLGIVPPASGPPRSPVKLVDVAEKFGITPETTSPILSSFFKFVNATGTLELVADLDPSTRNALWAVPGDPYLIVVSLAFQVQEAGALAKIASFVNDHFGLGITISPIKPRMVFTRRVGYVKNRADPSKLDVSSTYSLKISLQVATFELSATFNPKGLDLMLSDLQDTGTQRPIADRLGDGVLSNTGTATTTNPKSTDLPRPGSSGQFNSLLKTVDLWYLTVDREITDWQTNTTTGQAEPVYGRVFWRVGLLGAWRSGSDNKPLILALSYDSKTSSFVGELLFSTTPRNLIAERQYDYNPQMDLPPATRAMQNPNFNLWNLFSDSGDPPKLPTVVQEAKVSYLRGQTTDDTLFSLKIRAVTAAAITPNAAAAPEGFSWDAISVSALTKTTAQGSSTAIQIFTAFSLSPPPGPTFYPPATLRINFEYLSGSFWLLHGRVDNLSVGLLYNYFTHSVRDSAIGALGKLTLRYLDILYTYQPGSQGGSASSFLMTGTLVLGDLELDLRYQYASPLLQSGQKSAAEIGKDSGKVPSDTAVERPSGGNPSWSFEASLGTHSPGSTVGSVANSISENAADALPDFVAGIELAPKSGGTDFVKLRMAGNSDGGTVLTVWLTIADFSLTFVSVAVPGSKPKRILRVAANEIPLIGNIPLIRELPQPFDKLIYLWVDNDNDVDMTETDLKLINDELGLPQLKIDPIMVKAANKPGTQPGVLRSGHHFMVVEKGKIILDHCFSHSKSQTESLLARPNPMALVRRAEVATDGQEAPPTKGDLDKQLPFLSISAVSLQYKSGSIVLSFDATVTLTPIQFTVIGFEIGLNLSKVKLNHLDKLLEDFGTPRSAISVNIHGLNVNINKAPLLIAGLFIHEEAVVAGESQDIFKGGLALGFQAWQFLAVGEYANVKKLDDGRKYNSVFVFAKLDGPLVTLAFATISGVRLGFGYNSIVRSPTIKELTGFPFIDDSKTSGSGMNPMAILLKMTTGSGNSSPWVSIKENSQWVAAGMKLTAFGILSVTAVLMLGFRNSGVVISVFAEGICQMPPSAPSDVTLFYVEVGMLAELNTVDGYFTVQAALAPASHVLVPSCRLTGGFALVNWFAPNVHAGDFVFTVGGFHRAYTPPEWYPVPDRLGITFTLGDMINVTGNTYFAITPKCVMGGGYLHLGLDVGPVSAWLDVILDVFIQYKPFHYTADLSVSVGCAISIKIWFVHIRISISVGAALHIEGPDPFGGKADVNFYLFTFTIHFGGSIKPPDPIPLSDFYDMVQTPGPNDKTKNPPPTNAKLKFTLSSGLCPPATGPPPAADPQEFPNSGSTSTWRVKSGTFSFIVGFDFAISSAKLLQFENATDPTQNQYDALYALKSTDDPPKFYSKAMQLSDWITSEVTIAIYSYNATGEKRIWRGFTGNLTMKKVPVAVWGSYDGSTDPSRVRNPEVLKSSTDPTMLLAMGLEIQPPKSRPLPSAAQAFDATAAFREKIGVFPIPPNEPVQGKLLSAVAVANDTPTERWRKVKTEWKNSAELGRKILDDTVKTDGTKVDGLLSLAAKRLGWDNPPPSGVPAIERDGRKEWELSSKAPDNLIGGLDLLYAALPRYVSV